MPPEVVLAIGLFRLAHGCSYVAIGLCFNIGTTTVFEAVQDVVYALCALKGRCIKFPETLPEVIAARETFEEISNLPNVVGAIDGTHMRIQAPPVSAVDYFSRYQKHDTVVQAVVDGRNRFLDVSAGYPGSMHDA